MVSCFCCSCVALFHDNSFYYYSRSMYFLCISHFPLVYTFKGRCSPSRMLWRAFSTTPLPKCFSTKRPRENSSLCLIFLPCCAQNALLYGVLFLWWYPSPGMCQCNMLNLHFITLSLSLSFSTKRRAPLQTSPHFHTYIKEVVIIIIIIIQSIQYSLHSLPPAPLPSFFSISGLHQFNLKLPLCRLVQQLYPFQLPWLLGALSRWRATAPTLIKTNFTLLPLAHQSRSMSISIENESSNIHLMTYFQIPIVFKKSTSRR